MANEQVGNGYGWTADEFKGDGFEALVEVLINSMSTDKRIGIRNYLPNTERDMGIDGRGITNEVKSRPVTVQVKYRSDVTSELTTQDGISNFIANTTLDDDLKNAHMVFFTTARGINRSVLTEMYFDKPKVFGFNDIKKLIDNNPAFWDAFRTEMSK
jgi:hypothetical protein